MAQLASVISDKSLIPLGAAIGFLIAGISSAFWLNSTLLSIGYKIDALSIRIDGMESLEHRLAVLEHQGSEDWRAWVPLFKASNPTLVVPSADGGR